MGRTTWTDVPTTLRQQVEGVLGGPVVTAESQASGWSPGSADRVTTAAGERAFVKTVSRSRNEAALDLHRREAEVMAQLPTTVQAPRLLDALHAKVAQVDIARKLTVAIWHMLTRNESFAPRGAAFRLAA